MARPRPAHAARPRIRPPPAASPSAGDGASSRRSVRARNSGAAPQTLRRTLSLSVCDGVFFALMVGIGENFLVADALRLGASTFELALVVTLPLLCGALGPLIALRVLARVPLRRGVVVAGAWLQALNWLTLAVLDFIGGSSRRARRLACLPHTGLRARWNTMEHEHGGARPSSAQRATHRQTAILRTRGGGGKQSWPSLPRRSLDP